MIDRISLNGCRYLITRDCGLLTDWCVEHNVPVKWIRKKRKWFYLRLWGTYRDIGRVLKIYREQRRKIWASR